MKTLIEASNLRTHFYTFEGVVKALNGVGLVVKNGETYGLVGESGCGKSVSVRSMMRIVQSPGKIEDGEVVLYFNDEDKNKGIDILKQSETFMQSIRGNDISMIFQEASTALNPVLSIGFQVGESFKLHRLAEMVGDATEALEAELKNTSGISKFFKQRSLNCLKRELSSLSAYEKAVTEIDTQLYAISTATDKKSNAKRHELNNRRDNLQKLSWQVIIQRKIPFLKRYWRRINKSIRKFSVQLLTDLGVPNPDNVVDRYPHELSGGMQQRIVIAIALACHPTLLIADEPTSNLDVTIQAQILDLIKTLKNTKIASVLFITHDLGVVAEVCDRVTVMYAGDTCETARVNELFENPLHPYTQGLLNSVPKMEQTEKLETIKGTVPNLINPPSGCRFHPRCPHAMDVCKQVRPASVEMSEGHFVSCHLYPQPEEEV